MNKGGLTMKSRTYKGLAKLLIKESKNKELCFNKEQLEAIKSSAKVYLITRENGWKLAVGSKYGEGCGGGYYWRGWFEWDNEKKEGKMNVFSGFSGNLIGQVDQYYNCTRPQGTTYKKEFETLMSYMHNARLGSLSSMDCYREYVARTGDMN